MDDRPPSAPATPDRFRTFGAARSAPSIDRKQIAEAAREVLERALAPELRDDRFDGRWPPDGLIAAVEVDPDDRPAGYLGGAVDGHRLQLDGLLVPAPGLRPRSRPEDPAAEASDDLDRRAGELWRALEPAIDEVGAEVVELWGRPALDWHEALAARQGFRPLRALHQLRCELPIAVGVEPVASRPFEMARDADALIRVNNRAFASHPDQGAMTRQRLEDEADQPWFDPDGIRLLDDPDRPDTLAGFCWTKIHEPVAEGQPRLGEIYAIGVDPDHHGEGLGAPMTAAGLSWLAGQGLRTGMLYVEADNEPALRTYDRLGFRHHRTDRAWHREPGR